MKHIKKTTPSEGYNPHEKYNICDYNSQDKKVYYRTVKLESFYQISVVNYKFHKDKECNVDFFILIKYLFDELKENFIYSKEKKWASIHVIENKKHFIPISETAMLFITHDIFEKQLYWLYKDLQYSPINIIRDILKVCEEIFCENPDEYFNNFIYDVNQYEYYHYNIDDYYNMLEENSKKQDEKIDKYIKEHGLGELGRMKP